jgi:hypothetical protein
MGVQAHSAGRRLGRPAGPDPEHGDLPYAQRGSGATWQEFEGAKPS